jgi:DNA-binding response OmpR family regulator
MASNVRRSATRELEVYELSDLMIDVARQRITRADAEIALPRLSFDLLLVLIRTAPAVVSNDDLMAQVWP